MQDQQTQVTTSRVVEGVKLPTPKLRPANDISLMENLKNTLPVLGIEPRNPQSRFHRGSHNRDTLSSYITSSKQVREMQTNPSEAETRCELNGRKSKFLASPPPFL